MTGYLGYVRDNIIITIVEFDNTCNYIDLNKCAGVLL